jgi:molybdate transport system ATP-binding protein
MSLEAAVALRRGAFTLDVDLAVGAGEVVAVLGPNGAGKSLFLAALAGLVALDAGRVVLDGVVLDDPAAGTFVPPEARAVGVVFQEYRLFPHLSALENVAFGLRCQGEAAGAARRHALAWLERLGLAAAARSRPGALSGGQAQRVALARALAIAPRLLLLDEPLAALDVRSRADARRQLCAHLASFDGIRLLVTHDPLEAMALADRLVVLESGRVVQSDTPAAVAERPRSAWIADLVGVNLLRGRACGERVEVDGGGTLVIAGGADGEVFAVVHPRAVALHRRQPDGTPRNVWRGRIETLESTHGRARVRVGGPPSLVAEVTDAAVAEFGLAPGTDVWVTLKATEIITYPA